MVEFDVVVVGAGPAGAITAKLLAQGGIKTLLLEKNPFPTPLEAQKPCAGWVTPQVFKMVGVSPDSLDIEIQPIMGAVLYDRVGDALEPFVSTFSTPVSYGVIRQEFDDFLVQLAIDAGVQFEPGQQVCAASMDQNGVSVETRQGRHFQGSFLVGADSAHSTIARLLEIRPRWKPAELTLAMVSETPLASADITTLTPYRGMPELFFTKQGYAWYFTKQSHLNIGLGVQMTRLTREYNIARYYNDFLVDLARLERLPQTPLRKPRAYAYPVFVGPKYPTGKFRCLLTGDAGGFPQNLSGEGIRPAVITARCAADAIKDVLKNSKPLTALPRMYHASWKKALGFEYQLGSLGQFIYGQAGLFDLWRGLVREDDQFRRLFFQLMYAQGDPKALLAKLALQAPWSIPKLLFNRIFGK